MKFNLFRIDKNPLGLVKGIHDSDIAEFLGNPGERFKRTKDSDGYCLAFDQFGLHLDCNSTGEVVMYSVFLPNEVNINNENLLGITMVELEKKLCKNSIDFIRIDSDIEIRDGRISFIIVEDIVDGIEILLQ